MYIDFNIDGGGWHPLDSPLIEGRKIMTKKKVHKEEVEAKVEEKKESITIPLPAFYAGRCNTLDYYSARLFFPGSNRSHRYEIRVPLPDESNCMELFNLTWTQCRTKLAQSISTTVDKPCHAIIERAGVTPAEFTEEMHLEIQEVVDSWRNKERGGAKTIKLQSALDKLVARGVLTLEDCEGIEDFDTLMEKVSQIVG